MSEYSDFVRQYLTVAIFAGVGMGLALALLGVGKILRPSRPQEQKYLTYESGVDAVGSGWSQSQIRYYILALMFVVFDVEAVFIFPWATRVDVYGWFGIAAMGTVIVILGLGLLHAYRKRVIQWA